MFCIKEIIIEGFGCFKQKVVIKNIEKSINCFVGQNAAENTNVLAAIEYVFTGEFSRLVPTLKAFYVHHHDISITKGRVEIVLDIVNYERESIPNREVRVTRTINETISSLEMNDTAITFDDLVKYLRAAGYFIPFPKYCMLTQESLADLAMQSEPERLRMFTEFTGSAKFHLDYTKLRQTLDLHNNSMELFVTKIRACDEYRKVLRRELDDRQEVVNLKRKKASMEYHLKKKECDKLRSTLHLLDHKYRKTTLLLKQFEKEADTAQKYHEKLKRYNRNAQGVHPIFAALEEYIKSQIKSKECMEREIESALRESGAERPAKPQLVVEMAQLSRKITDVDAQVTSLSKKISNAIRLSNRIDLESPEQRQEYLYAEMEKRDEFEVVGDLNEMLLQLLRQVKVAMQAEEHALKKCEEETCERILAQKHRLMIEAQKKLKMQQEEIEKTVEMSRQLFFTYITEFNMYERAKEVYEDSVPSHIKLAHRTIRTIFERCREEKVDLEYQFFGMLIDIFHCPSKLAPALNMIVGDVLYNFVVASSNVAVRILDYQGKFKLPGDLRFLILDQYEDTSIPYPHGYCIGSDMLPVVHVLGYNYMFRPLIVGVMGNIISCENPVKIEPPSQHIGKFRFIMQGNAIWDINGSISVGMLDSEAPIVKASRCREHYYASQNMKALVDMEDDQYEKEIGERAKINRLLACVTEEHNRLLAKKSDYLVNLNLQKEMLNMLTAYRLRFEELLKGHCTEIDGLQTRFEQLKVYLQEKRPASLYLPDDFPVVGMRSSVPDALPSTSAAAAAKANSYDALRAKRANLLRQLRRLRTQRDEIVKSTYANLSNSVPTKLENSTNKLATLEVDLLYIMDINSFMRQRFQAIVDTDKVLSAQHTHHNFFLNSLETTLSKLSKDLKAMLEEYDEVAHDLDERMLENQDFTMNEAHLEYERMELEELRVSLAVTDKLLADHTDPFSTESLKEYQCTNKQLQILNDATELAKTPMGFKFLIQKVDEQNLKLFRRRFVQFSRTIGANFKQLAPRGVIDIYLRKAERNTTGFHTLDCYDGIGMYISFDNKRRRLSRARMLTTEQRTIAGFAILFSMVKYDIVPFVLMDHADRFISQPNIRPIVQMLKEMSQHTQFFIISGHPEFLARAGSYFSIHWHNDSMCICRTHFHRVLNILNQHGPSLSASEICTLQPATEK